MLRSDERTPLGLCFVDVTRLLIRARKGVKNATGIDRVVIDYWRRAEDWYGSQCIAAVVSPFGARVLEDVAASSLHTYWRVDRAWPGHASSKRRLYHPRPEDIALFTGHLGLEWAATRRWLSRFGPRAHVFVHDVLPISHPEFFTNGEALRHRKRIGAIEAVGASVIVNSHATADALTAVAPALRARISVAPLDVPAAFKRSVRKPSVSDFLVLGTIEPRKNHELLLDIWQELHSEFGINGPVLHVVGRLGWGNIARRFPAIAARNPLVRHHDSLGDGDLAALMETVCAVLAPSFAEGFGLPVAEAIAAGAPVLCSDIPAHREVAGDRAHFLDPREKEAWRQAIRAALKADASPY